MEIKHKFLAASIAFLALAHSDATQLSTTGEVNLFVSDGHVVRIGQAFCPADSTSRYFGNGPNATKEQCTNRYGIYTDVNFWGGRGISLVTTENVVNKAVLAGLNQYYQQTVGLQVARHAFREHHIDGKGIGLVATRRLRKGELIIWEPPSLLVHLNMREHVSDEVRLSMQRAAVDALPLTTKSETLGLMGHWGGDAIEDRLDTNSFTVTLEKPMDHHALFTQTSVGECGSH
jgi:hypothetical protein